MKVLVPLAEGFEEIEAVTVIDVLRRAGLTVTTAALSGLDVKGSHGIIVKADTSLSECDPSMFDAIALPGGPGTKNLRESERVIEFIKAINAKNGVCAAVCAAPTVLARAGILKGKKVTCFPGEESNLGGGFHTGANAEIDGQIVTGKSAGTALVFSLMLVKALLGKDVAAQMKSKLYASMEGLDF